MNSKLIVSLIIHYSAIFGVAPNVSLAVAQVESGLNPNAVGTIGEVGLFQLKPQDFPGYKKTQLFEVETNIILGIKYLAWNKKYCNHKEDIFFTICYNKGIFGGSKIKYPDKDKYYLKVLNVYKNLSKL